MVVIIDYNIGNLSSVISALKRVGIEAVITRDKDIICQAKAIVLPVWECKFYLKKGMKLKKLKD